MFKLPQKIIFCLFAFLIFFVPLILWPFTSEVFEFNKIVLTYALTSLITGVWLIRCISEKKFIFRRTILDIPLLVFFASQLISTILSIDFYTSVFGYYSRFNGGLLSTICYLLLYWAFVSSFDRKDTLKLIKIWFASAAIVSIYGVLEHFGIDKNIWVQDVQSRIFSSLGQPNWLAAWVVALIPLAWALMLNSKLISQNSNLYLKSKNFWIYFFLSVLLFWTLIFTKSRSGFLGFGTAFIVFWGFYFWKNLKNLSTTWKPFAVISFSLLVISLISGTAFTPSVSQYLNRSQGLPAEVLTKAGTALEIGGTESGTIRKIVWTGAIQIWLHYPVFGTGVETFAYSYYLYRPVAHNLTSEWDFIYNKAHNEYLNFAANSGTIGLLSYLALIIFTITQISKSEFLISKQIPNSKLGNSKNYLGQLEQLEISNLRIALAAGYVSILASNFFGFSVVPTQLEFFLFPAIAITLTKSEELKVKNDRALNLTQKIAIAALLLFTFYLLFLISRYWYADTLYSRAKGLNSASRPDLAIPALTQAIKSEPDQAIYYGELASSYATTVAMAYNQAKDASQAAQFTDYATATIQKALDLAPANVNLGRTAFGVYIRLSVVDEKYLVNARDSLIETLKLAPTDAKLYYNLGITDANLGNYEAAAIDLQKAVDLKANYADARVQYAAVLAHLGRVNEAQIQLNYILTQIDPGNQTAKQALENLK